MERKTKITVEDGKQELVITREFDLPLELLFTAYSEPEIIEQWMDNEVVHHESKKYGSWQFRKKDKDGNVVFSANGVYHAFVPNEKITRTFEMDNTHFPPQLEFFTFESLTEDTSRLTMHVIYKSAALRDEMVKMGMHWGINMAHDRLQEILTKTTK